MPAYVVWLTYICCGFVLHKFSVARLHCLSLRPHFVKGKAGAATTWLFCANCQLLFAAFSHNEAILQFVLREFSLVTLAFNKPKGTGNGRCLGL